MLASPIATCAALDDGITALVRSAPTLDPREIERMARAALEIAIAAITVAPDSAALALAIERTLDGIADGTIAQGVGLPALAMAAFTLGQSIRAGADRAHAAIDAARFELETLFPLIGHAPVPAKPGPDVSLARLSPQLASALRGKVRVRADRLAALIDVVDNITLTTIDDRRRRYDDNGNQP